MLSESAWALDASALYDKKCKSCHSLGGVAGPMAKVGGPLDGVGSKRDEAWLRAYFKDRPCGVHTLVEEIGAPVRPSESMHEYALIQALLGRVETEAHAQKL